MDHSPPASKTISAGHRSFVPQSWTDLFWRNARKVVVAVIGGTLVLLGVAMLVLPGPGWATIFGGLAVLASEFAWARWVLKRAREQFDRVVNMARNGLGAPLDTSDSTQKGSANRSSQS